MYYQVVAKPSTPSGSWDYYPYWAPIRDKDAAMRLATYAAQAGCEAAVLRSVTLEMLQFLARGVVDRQDAHLLPALRYMPNIPSARDSSAADPNGQRLNMVIGPGGSIIHQSESLQSLADPQGKVQLRRWMALRQLQLDGRLGGPLDGAPDGEPLR
jgi:hypothetical protein